LIRFGVPDGI